ncbi:MAG TPA: hypothetical protein DCZ72_01385 [Armatimonadetes bacterium]|nr:hypothetical protein [Armatimonadota bacterium]
MRRIDRYIFGEVLWPFVAAQMVFVVMFIGTEALTEATKLIARYGLPWFGVIQLLLLRIPWAIGWTMPMSVGMAVILAVGRICKDIEYTPMIVGGMSYRRMLMPLLLFAVLVSSLAYWIEEYAGPKTMLMYHIKKMQLQNQATAKQFDVSLRLNDSDNAQRIMLYAGELEPKRPPHLREVEVIQFGRDGLPQTVFYSRLAEWRAEEQEWFLQDGIALYFGSPDEPPITNRFDEIPIRQIAGQSGFGSGLVFESSPNEMLIASTTKPDYLTYSGIRARVRHMVAAGRTAREINRVKVHIHRRSTLSFSCIVFLVIGAALAVRPQRGQALGTAFAMGVGLLLTYYILWNAACFLAEASPQPGLMCWSTNIVGLAVGLWLTKRVPD